jgi:hypothetical protein
MNQKPAITLITWKGAAFIAGVLTLFWLPVEDQTVLIPTLLSLPIAGLVASLFRERFRLSYIIYGLVAGLVVAPLTLLWMAFKTGIHGHGGVADFTASQILSVIDGAPFWTLAGGLLGWAWQGIRSRKASSAARKGE